MDKVQRVIDRLEQMNKQGESYDEKGRHGWRNPIRSDTGSILEALVLAHDPQRILEIGTAHGLSGCYLARQLKGWQHMVSIEWDEKTAQEAQANFNEALLPVEVICGDAMKVIPELAKLKDTVVGGRKVPLIDMVFLDANKDGYLEQIKLLVNTGLLRMNALVVADNVIDRQTECQNFLDYVKSFPHVILQTECGLLVGTI